MMKLPFYFRLMSLLECFGLLVCFLLRSFEFLSILYLRLTHLALECLYARKRAGLRDCHKSRISLGLRIRFGRWRSCALDMMISSPWSCYSAAYVSRWGSHLVHFHWHCSSSSRCRQHIQVVLRLSRRYHALSWAPQSAWLFSSGSFSLYVCLKLPMGSAETLLSRLCFRYTEKWLLWSLEIWPWIGAAT